MRFRAERERRAGHRRDLDLRARCSHGRDPPLMLGGEGIPVPARLADGHPLLEGGEDRRERELASPRLPPTAALPFRSDARPSSAPGLWPGRLRSRDSLSAGGGRIFSATTKSGILLD